MLGAGAGGGTCPIQPVFAGAVASSCVFSFSCVCSLLTAWCSIASFQQSFSSIVMHIHQVSGKHNSWQLLLIRVQCSCCDPSAFSCNRSQL